MYAQNEGTTLLLCWWETKLTCLTSGTSMPNLSLQRFVDQNSQVTLEEATAKSTQLNIMFMETSAKAGHNVKSLFKKIAMSLPGMEKENQADPNTSVLNLPI